MKNLGFNAVIAALVISAGLGLYRNYMLTRVDTAIAEVSAEAKRLLVINADDCGYTDLLKAYALDGSITIDEGHSLVAICEANAHAKTNVFDSKRRTYEVKLKRHGGVRM